MYFNYLYCIVHPFFIYCISQRINPLLYIITSDSLFSSLHFFISSNVNASVYIIGTIERYILYLMYMIFQFLLYIFFIQHIQLISLNEYMLFTTIISNPIIINYFVCINCIDIINNIIDFKNKIIKSIYKELFYTVFFTICDNNNIIINKQHFSYKFDILMNKIDYSSIFYRVCVIFVMLYIRSWNSIYYNICKYAYYYLYNKYFKYIENPKELVINNLMNKQFGFLITDEGVQSIIQLYLSGKDNNTIIEYINYKFMSMISIWSLCSIFNQQLTPITLLLINYPFEYTSMSNLLWSNTPMLFIYINDNYLLISFLSQFGKLLFHNRFVFNNFRKLFKKCYILIQLCHYDIYVYIKNILFAMCIKYILYTNKNQLIYILPFTQYTSPINIIAYIINDSLLLFLYIYLVSMYQNYTYNKFRFYVSLNNNEVDFDGCILDNEMICGSVQSNIVITDDYFNNDINTNDDVDENDFVKI